MRRKKFFVVSLVLLLGGLLFSTPASAITIDDINDDFVINWTCTNCGGNADADLSATGTFDVTAVGANSLSLTVTVANNTVIQGLLVNAGITTFGFGVDPNATSVTFAQANPVGDTNAFIDAEVQAGQQNFPGGFKDIDVCVFTQGCAGGAQGSGLAAGATDTFTLVITGVFNGPIVLTPFPIKFQTGLGSFEFAGDEGGGTPVPEPGTIILLGSGLFGLGLNQWRKRAK